METVHQNNLSTAARQKSQAAEDFWNAYDSAIPPGKASYELRQSPLIALAVDADTRGYATAQIYQAATAMMNGWLQENYGGKADPEWAQARNEKRSLNAAIAARYGQQGLTLLQQYDAAPDALSKSQLRLKNPTINGMLSQRSAFSVKHPIYAKYFGTSMPKAKGKK